MSGKLDEYLWIAVVAGIFGFVYCFGIGANDVANAFATSVASKSLTLKQAVVVASICEFCGVMFLGASVTSTVRGKIFDASQYEDEPEMVMLGMFTSIVTASIMLLGATYYALPVSTTHVVIGCIIGFSVAAKGFSSVNWNETKNIFISWVAAPLLTGVVGFFVFGFIRKFILTSQNPFQRGYYTFSFILFITIGINLFFIFNKGTKNFEHFQEEVYDDKWVVPVSFAAGAFVGLLWLWPVGPIAKKKLEERREAMQGERAVEGETAAVAHGASSRHSKGSADSLNRSKKTKVHPSQICMENSSKKIGLANIGTSVVPSSVDTIDGSTKLSRASLGGSDMGRSMARSMGGSSKRKITMADLRKSLQPDGVFSSAQTVGSAGSVDHAASKMKVEDVEHDIEEGTTKVKLTLDQSLKSVKLAIGEASAPEEIPTCNKSSVKEKPKKTFFIRFEEATYKQNLEEQCFQEDVQTRAIWENAATYDNEVEQLFTYVQVFTAALSSFAHGANDIANAIAPVSAIFSIYQTGALSAEAPVEPWILAYGGVALVLGLLLYGYKVMKTIGYKLTALSPTRGSSAALSTSLIVATASYIGIPVSTTQSIVGAVAGIGLVEGYKNVQWLQLAKVCVSWVIVFFVAAIFSAGLFAFCAYSPSYNYV